MIQIESVAIRELRGIRDLEVTPDRKNFVVSGPNGSGKSGLVDAIEFALTGVMSRLSGKGTRGLSVKTHGPHVDRRHDPASAKVSLRFYVPELDKSAALTRNVKNPRAVTLAPDDPEIRGIIERSPIILKLGARSANKWNNKDAKETVAALKDSRKEALDAYYGEQWVLNRAVHFNEWAQFTKAEFREVVEAFQPSGGAAL